MYNDNKDYSILLFYSRWYTLKLKRILYNLKLFKQGYKQAAPMPPIFFSPCLPLSFSLSLTHTHTHTHTHTMFFSFKKPRGANKCQAVPVHWWLLSPRPEKQRWRLARCPPTPRPSSQHSGRGGSWEKERPTDQQLLWRWLSDWPGCCTPPSPRSGHLTLGKLTNAWAFGCACRVMWPWGRYDLTRLGTHFCLPYVPNHNVFRAPDQVNCTWSPPALSSLFDLLSWKLHSSQDAFTQEKAAVICP